MFSEGLLPEGFTRRTVAQWMHVAEGDYLSILHGLGKECLGALCISVKGEETASSYEPVTEHQVRELAAEGIVKTAEMVTKSRLSLTGASGKVGLYYDSGHDAWFLPRATAPSTHIVKQSHVRLDAIVTNEQLSLLTAEECGIGVVKSLIINTGSGDDGEVLLATERYDRVFIPESGYIGKLPCPRRLHQEDFAQAMGIPAADKYESGRRGYLHRMFGILKRYSSNPVIDQMRLWDLIVFNYLLGNTDSHLKNFSLLYSPDQRSVRLAPACDIVSTSVYTESTRDMAFYIGGSLSPDDICRDAFREAAKEAGIGDRLAMRHYDSICGRFQNALHSAAKKLAEQGFAKAKVLEQQIMESGGIRSAEK